jgi:Fe-S cluster assembly protein SufD
MPETLSPGVALEEERVLADARRRGEPDFLLERRRLALETWNSLPLPGRQDETWRRVKLAGLDLAAAAAGPYQGVALALSRPEARGAFWGDVARAVREVPALLKTHWATTVYPAGETAKARRGGKFHALNQALFDGGYVLHLPPGAKADAPFHAVCHTPASAAGAFPHHLVVLEDGAEATLIEEHRGAGTGLCNAQTEIVLGLGARLHYILLQTAGPAQVYLGAHRARLQRGARVTFSGALLGARLSKTFLEAELAEPGAEALLYGLYYGRGKQQTHLDTWQHHVAPGCRSDLLFKGVLDDAAGAVYRGMIRLEPGAQKTDAYQQNRTLLLSTDACMHSIPGLEICADDVRCTHGATAGQVDPEMLFYLRSRGLTPAQARKAIVDGFLEDVLLRFQAPGVIASLREQLAARMDGPTAQGGKV